MLRRGQCSALGLPGGVDPGPAGAGRQQQLRGARRAVRVDPPAALHYPHPDNSRDFPGQEFRSIAKSAPIKPYPIPFRCLYSRNVENLMMAGRNISVTHVALGTVRVQRTTGMMGEVLGMAASVCRRHGVDPRQVYARHLDELKSLLARGVGRPAEQPVKPSAGR